MLSNLRAKAHHRKSRLRAIPACRLLKIWARCLWRRRLRFSPGGAPVARAQHGVPVVAKRIVSVQPGLVKSRFDVRFGSEADILSGFRDVGLTPSKQTPPSSRSMSAKCQ